MVNAKTPQRNKGRFYYHFISGWSALKPFTENQGRVYYHIFNGHKILRVHRYKIRNCYVYYIPKLNYFRTARSKTGANAAVEVPGSPSKDFPG